MTVASPRRQEQCRVIIQSILNEFPSLTLAELICEVRKVTISSYPTIALVARTMCQGGEVTKLGGNGGRYLLPHNLAQAKADLRSRILQALPGLGDQATYTALLSHLSIDRSLLTEFLKELLDRDQITVIQGHGIDLKIYRVKGEAPQQHDTQFDPELARKILRTVRHFRQTLMGNLHKHAAREIVEYHVKQLVHYGLISVRTGENEARSVIYGAIEHAQTTVEQVLNRMSSELAGVPALAEQAAPLAETPHTGAGEAGSSQAPLRLPVWPGQGAPNLFPQTDFSTFLHAKPILNGQRPAPLIGPPFSPAHWPLNPYLPRSQHSPRWVNWLSWPGSIT